MKPSRPRDTNLNILLGLLAVACLSLSTSARAQNNDSGGYAIGEDRGQQTSIGHGSPDDGPVRLARFSYVHGTVTWRPDDSAEWSAATVNLPIRQGAQVWVSDGGRAEVQFDDGSILRLGNSAIATLQTLYSDSEGEFTEIKLTDGLASLRLKHDHSVFQIDTPLASIKSTGPAKLRIGTGDGVEVGVRSGAATVEGPQGKVAMQAGDYLDVANDSAAFNVRALPGEDSWEQWNDDRDSLLASADADYREHRLPPNIALVATGLDQYGDWRNEPQYGWVWCPRVAAVDWRPYLYGHWTWVNPFGWTWVSDEPWGWAPYHYGTWAHVSRGWAWVPGPAAQCWSPAVVNFTESEGRVAWCPLAPAEVHYGPAIALGFRAGNWALFFSIGRAAVYYPGYAGYCEPRYFNTAVINHVTYVRNVTNIYNAPGAFSRYQNSSEGFAANNNTYLNARFVPINARAASGVTAAAAGDFGGRNRYEPVMGQAGTGLFQRGRAVSAPPQGRAPIAGPIVVKPTAQALTPSRTYLPNMHPMADAVTTPVYRSPLQPAIARGSAPVRTVAPGGSGPVHSNVDRTPPILPNRNSTAGVSQDLPGRSGLPGRPSGSIDRSTGAGARTDGAAGLTDAQIRARNARNALGLGNTTGSASANSGRSDSRQYPYADRARTGPPASSTDSRRGDSATAGGRYRTSDVPRSPDVRRDPVPGARRDREPPRSSGSGDRSSDSSKRSSSDTKDKDNKR